MRNINLSLGGWLLLGYLLLLFTPSGNGKAAETERESLVSSLGFSIMSPPGKNWKKEYVYDSVQFTKKTDSEIRTFFARATELHFSATFTAPEEFLTFIEKKRKESDHSGDLKIVDATYMLYPRVAPYCVKYQERYEHSGTSNGEGRALLMEESIGLTCLHPDDNTIGIDIFYSDRYVDGQGLSLLRREGDMFLESLKFVPSRKSMQNVWSEFTE